MDQLGLRVLLVGRGQPERGGIAAFLDAVLVSRLVEDHDVSFLNLTPAERRDGGRFDRRNLVRTFADAAALWRLAPRQDVVHLHSALAPLPTLLRAGALSAVARLRGARVVVHAHGGRIPGWLRTPARRAVARLSLWPAAAVVTVSTAGRTAIAEAIGEARVHLVDNGVDPGPAPPQPTDPAVPRVLFVGVLTERKGVLDLLQASAAVRARGVAHELWLVGGTPDEGPEAEAAVRDAAGPTTRLLGQIEHGEVLALLREVDLFCLPSWWEAMPLSILEAMAAGLPVVATEVGDVPRLVLDGTTGVLVPPRSPEALADALATLLVAPDRRRDMGSAGRAHVVDRFTLARTLDELERVYRSVAEGR